MIASFGTTEYLEEQKQAVQALPVLWVPHHPRKDGKFKVTYGFASRSISAILTPEKLESEKASGKYQVRTSFRGV